MHDNCPLHRIARRDAHNRDAELAAIRSFTCRANPTSRPKPGEAAFRLLLPQLPPLPGYISALGAHHREKTQQSGRVSFWMTCEVRYVDACGFIINQPERRIEARYTRAPEGGFKAASSAHRKQYATAKEPLVVQQIGCLPTALPPERDWTCLQRQISPPTLKH